MGLIQSILKIKLPKTHKKKFKQYISFTSDIKQIVDDLEFLKKQSKDNSKEIDALESSKKVLEDEISVLEEAFYDERKGLWTCAKLYELC